MRSEDLKTFSVSNLKWVAATNIFEFLKFATHATNTQFGTKYVSFSLIDRFSTKLESLCDSHMNGTEAELFSFVSKLKQKLHS